MRRPPLGKVDFDREVSSCQSYSDEQRRREQLCWQACHLSSEFVVAWRAERVQGAFQNNGKQPVESLPRSVTIRGWRLRVESLRPAGMITIGLKSSCTGRPHRASIEAGSYVCSIHSLGWIQR